MIKLMGMNLKQNLLIFMRICINLQESLFIVENIIYESDFRCTQKISVDNKKTESIGIFELIGTIIPKINKNRKRIINIIFIMKKVFEMMNI